VIGILSTTSDSVSNFDEGGIGGAIKDVTIPVSSFGVVMHAYSPSATTTNNITSNKEQQVQSRSQERQDESFM
jgi:hypothetical protein